MSANFDAIIRNLKAIARRMVKQAKNRGETLSQSEALDQLAQKRGQPNWAAYKQHLRGETAAQPTAAGGIPFVPDAAALTHMQATHARVKDLGADRENRQSRYLADLGHPFAAEYFRARAFYEALPWLVDEYGGKWLYYQDARNYAIAYAPSLYYDQTRDLMDHWMDEYAQQGWPELNPQNDLHIAINVYSDDPDFFRTMARDLPETRLFWHVPLNDRKQFICSFTGRRFDNFLRLAAWLRPRFAPYAAPLPADLAGMLARADAATPAAWTSATAQRFLDSVTPVFAAAGLGLAVLPPDASGERMRDTFHLAITADASQSQQRFDDYRFERMTLPTLYGAVPDIAGHQAVHFSDRGWVLNLILFDGRLAEFELAG